MGVLKKNKPHFRTNVFLKNIIGNELINNDNIAILELVKNSFDAGSKKVEISFVNIKNNNDHIQIPFSAQSSKIIVQDWGSGMNKKSIVDNWLNIAYSEKKKKKKEFGRILAGAKGIGRFSTDRLGKYLNIYTKKKTDNQYTHLQVDWTSFEMPENKDLDIQEIPVKILSISKERFENISGYKPFEKGTIIEISHLREKWAIEEQKSKQRKIWNTKPLTDLKKYLEKLINPNQVLGDRNTFNIFLYASEFEKEDERNKKKGKYLEVINGKIENKIFEKLNFHTTSIEAIVSDDNKTITTTLSDKGRIIYTLVEDISKSSNFTNLRKSKAFIFFLNTYAKSYFKRQTGISAVNFGSIFLFKNGFRIPPYGEEGDDWLGLERRKGQGQRRFLGTRDIVGRIEIFDSQNIFREVTSREGLVENKPFEDLKESFFFTTLRRLEKYVVEGLNWDSIPPEMKKAINTNTFEQELFAMSKEEKDKNAIKAISSLVKTHGEGIIKLHINSEVIATLATEEKEKFEEVYRDLQKIGIPNSSKSLRNSLNEIRKVIEKKDEEIRLLKEKSVVVESEDLFKRDDSDRDEKELIALQHHINQSTERIRFYLNELRLNIQKNAPKDSLIPQLDRVSFENKKISTLSKFVTKAKFNLITALVTQDIVKFIKEYISNVYQRYDHRILNKELINVFIIMKEDFEFTLTFRPIDFIIIIDNLLDNAQNAKASSMELRIIKSGEDTLKLKFKDNGKGLDKRITNPSQIFDFGFTTTEGGTGIGLYHINSILKKMKSEIEVHNQNQGGVEFIITIKK